MNLDPYTREHLRRGVAALLSSLDFETCEGGAFEALVNLCVLSVVECARPLQHHSLQAQIQNREDSGRQGGVRMEDVLTVVGKMRWTDPEWKGPQFVLEQWPVAQTPVVVVSCPPYPVEYRDRSAGTSGAFSFSSFSSSSTSTAIRPPGSSSSSSKAHKALRAIPPLFPPKPPPETYLPAAQLSMGDGDEASRKRSRETGNGENPASIEELRSLRQTVQSRRILLQQALVQMNRTPTAEPSVKKRARTVSSSDHRNGET